MRPPMTLERGRIQRGLTLVEHLKSVLLAHEQIGSARGTGLDDESVHQEMDHVVTEFLRASGQAEAADLWEKNRRWFA